MVRETQQTPRYVRISTDEVYGSIDPPHDADENYPLRTSSSYSASKADAHLLAWSYFVTLSSEKLCAKLAGRPGSPSKRLARDH